MLTKKQVEEIAFKIRLDFENQKIDENELGELYQRYNSIKSIDSFIQIGKEVFPNLNCGLATVYLKKLFPDSEIIKGKYGDNNHTFLLLDERVVVDITSDQYGGPRVYVGPLRNPWSVD